MNRTFDTLAQSSRLTDGTQQAPAAPRSFHAGVPDQALFRLDLVRSLKMHRRLALGFALVGVILAALYVVKNRKEYSAQSLVYIQPTPSAVLEQAPMHWPYNYDPATYDSYIQQQILSMTRPDVLMGAVKKLGPGVWQQSGESEQSVADRLKGMVEVARVGTSYQVAITAHASNPDTAAALANALAASYIENTAHEQKAGDAERLAMLKEERDRIKKELDDDRSEQAALNAQLGVAAIGPMAPEHYDDDIAKMHDALVQARTDHDKAAAQLTSVNSGSGLSSAALDAEADQLILTDPGLSSLKQALLTRRAALVSQMANLTPNHPLYKQDQAELAKIDASLESATQDLRAKAAARIEEQLHTDLDRTSSLEARLNGELAQMTRAAAGATPKLQRSSDLANDITRLQNRFNTVDEQLQNQTLEDAAPGTAHMAAAAVPPAHASDAGVIRNALLLLFLFAGLGVAAAVMRHKMDPRVYIASDVEQILGYPPMAQLPDFDEVSDEVAEEHLLRLATGIEYAAKDGRLKSCVFTGAGPEVGVTTIAASVKKMLGVLGEEAVLMDAAGPLPAERHPGGGNGLVIRSTALTPKAGEEAAADREALVLTDTAPLTVSAEAEYLARRADCTILVIESGKTTRAQLRAAAASLQRLNAAAVGFVLNRVSLKNADADFRHSVSEMERHLLVQGRTAVRTVAQTTRVVSEPAQISSPREISALAEAVVAAAVFAESAAPPALSAEPEETASEPVPLPPPAPPEAAIEKEPEPLPPIEPLLAALRSTDRVSYSAEPAPSHPQHEAIVLPFPEYMHAVAAEREPQPEVEPFPADAEIERKVEPVAAPAAQAAAEVAELPAPQPAQFMIDEPRQQSVSLAVKPPAQQAQEEIPWWLAEAPAHAETALIEPGATRVGTWQSDAENDEPASVAEEPRRAEVKEPASEAPTRLSGLRGILFSLGIKDLSQKKRTDRNGNGNGNGSGNILGIGLQSPDEAPAEAAAAEPEQTIVLEPAPPPPAREPVKAKAEGAVTRGAVPRWVTAEPEFLPPRQEADEKGKESRWGKGRRDEENAFDDIQILPSKRGQYRR
jgi:polysaccharide biosynthesis transport protein